MRLVAAEAGFFLPSAAPLADIFAIDVSSAKTAFYGLLEWQVARNSNARKTRVHKVFSRQAVAVEEKWSHEPPQRYKEIVACAHLQKLAEEALLLCVSFAHISYYVAFAGPKQWHFARAQLVHWHVPGRTELLPRIANAGGRGRGQAAKGRNFTVKQSIWWLDLSILSIRHRTFDRIVSSFRSDTIDLACASGLCDRGVNRWCAEVVLYELPVACGLRVASLPEASQLISLSTYLIHNH
nr:hypothetical protein CFP56_24501 [Quercus suber]